VIVDACKGRPLERPFSVAEAAASKVSPLPAKLGETLVEMK